MTLDDFQKISKSAGSNLCWLNITGGEPTDRHDLPEIIRIFKTNCPNLLFVNLSTNGLRPNHIENIVQQIASLSIPVFAVNVSLDGPREINDQIRGIKGSFDKVIETYKLIKKQNSVRSMLAMTLYESNFNLIKETYLNVKKVLPDVSKSEFHFNLGHHSEHHYGNHNGISNPHQKKQLLSAVKSFSRSFVPSIGPVSIIERMYRSKFERYFRTGKSPVECVALMSSVYISEKGDLYPCTIWNKNLGSILPDNQSIDGLLASETGKFLRKTIRESNCDNCWSPCEAFPSILGNLLPFK